MTAWKRLRIVEVPAETDTDRTRRLADALDEGRVLSEDDRRDAARLLRTWTAPKRRPGRPRDSRAPHIALDYLVQRELRGPRATAAALYDVARAWCDGKEATVKDAWTDWQVYARWRLDQLTKGRVGTELVLRGRKVTVTRRQILTDISADLRDEFADVGREK